MSRLPLRYGANSVRYSQGNLLSPRLFWGSEPMRRPPDTGGNMWDKKRRSSPPHSLTWKTSVSRNLVPNTVMPLVSMEARSLRGRGLVSFLLQSRTRVTVFFSTLMATRCHLAKSIKRRGEKSNSTVSRCVRHKTLLQKWSVTAYWEKTHWQC